MNSILIPVAVVTVVAGLFGYFLAFLLLRPRKNQQIDQSGAPKEPDRPEERYTGDIFSPRGRRIYYFIIFWLCLCAWFFLVHWWVARLAARPNGGTFLIRASEDELQYDLGLPIAVFSTVIVSHLIWRLFAPGAYASYRRDVGAKGGLNWAAVHPIAALVILASLGCYASLKLTCYTRFNNGEVIFRAPWSLHTKVYPYSRARVVLQQRDRDDVKERAKRFAIVFDDGQVWLREDYGSLDQDLEPTMNAICGAAHTPLPSPVVVESIEAEIKRLGRARQEWDKSQANN